MYISIKRSSLSSDFLSRPESVETWQEERYILFPSFALYPNQQVKVKVQIVIRFASLFR